MPRDPRAYLVDLIDACDAIEAAVQGLDLPAYQANRLIRSSVEREFIIGEAMAALSRTAPRSFNAISRARRIVDFRNRLTHEYTAVDDALVWAVATNDIAVRKSECKELLARATPRHDDD